MSKHAPAHREVSGGLQGELPSPAVVGGELGLVIAMRTFVGQQTASAVMQSTLVTINGAYSSGTVTPPSPSPGDRWFKTDVGVMFTYVDDGSSQQWVEV